MQGNIKSSYILVLLPVIFLGLIVFINLNTVSPTHQTASVAEFNSNLIAHYTFDDTTNDSAESNHGTASGEPTYIDGKIGKAMQFDGVDDKVTVPSTATLNPSTITLAFWANIPGPGAANNTLIELGSNVNNFRVRDTNGELQLLTNSAGNNLSGATNSLVYGQWTHWVFIGNSSGLSIYKNGILNASNATAYTASANAVWNIGSAGFFIKQTLDDVRIYNRTLSATEIRQLYNQGR